MEILFYLDSHQVVTIDPTRIRIQFSSPAGKGRSGGRGGGKAPLGISAQAVLQEAARGLDAALKRMCGGGCVAGDHALAVTINTTSAEHDLNWDSDESYRLHVTTKGIVSRGRLGGRHACTAVTSCWVAYPPFSRR